MSGNLKDLTLRTSLNNHSGTNKKNYLGGGSGGPGVGLGGPGGGFRTGKSSGKPLLLPVLKNHPQDHPNQPQGHQNHHPNSFLFVSE